MSEQRDTEVVSELVFCFLWGFGGNLVQLEVRSRSAGGFQSFNVFPEEVELNKIGFGRIFFVTLNIHNQPGDSSRASSL